MGIGVSIFLIALGLILALATDFDLAGLDIQIVGWILVASGLVGLAMTAMIWGPRRRAGRADIVDERTIVEDRTRY